MKIALVTGASSGLGREFVRQIAEQGKVEEIWAIARRRDRLEALQSISAVPIRCWRLTDPPGRYGVPAQHPAG